MGCDHSPVFGETGIFNFFRRMASAAVGRGGLRAKGGLHAGRGMTGGALGMPRKGCKNAARIELVAEGAVGAETGPRVHPTLRVYVFRVRELEQDGARFLKARIGQQSDGIGYVALLANLDVGFVREGFRMAGVALVVAGSL